MQQLLLLRQHNVGATADANKTRNDICLCIHQQILWALKSGGFRDLQTEHSMGLTAYRSPLCSRLRRCQAKSRLQWWSRIPRFPALTFRKQRRRHQANRQTQRCWYLDPLLHSWMNFGVLGFIRQISFWPKGEMISEWHQNAKEQQHKQTETLRKQQKTLIAWDLAMSSDKMKQGKEHTESSTRHMIVDTTSWKKCEHQTLLEENKVCSARLLKCLN